MRHAIAEAEAHAADGGWELAAPDALVALFAWLHREIYGVSVEDEMRQDWMPARSAASKLLREVFSGDAAQAMEFMRYVWRRELEKDEWRQRNGIIHFKRLRWRDVFVNRSTVTDWHMAEQKEKRECQ